MPKVTFMKYVVSFNGNYDDEYGDSDTGSADWTGDDVDALAAEVIANDPNFPMMFVRNTGADEEDILGWFVDPNDYEYKVAVMMTREYFQG